MKLFTEASSSRIARPPEKQVAHWSALLIVLCLAGSLSCTGERDRPLAEAPSVVFIVIDTLRADHVGAYGADRDLTPNLDRVAAEGIVFENAIATSSWTRSSVASMLTSRYPSEIGVLGRDDAIGEDLPTLAEILRDEGFRTLGVSTNKNAGQPYGFGRGFERFEVPEIFNSYPGDYEIHIAEGVTQKALELLDSLETEQPFFLFLHYVDPHDPYLPHPGLLTEAEPPGRFNGSRRHLRHLDRTPDDEITEDDLARIRYLYAGEVKYCDYWVGQLLDGLEQRGLGDAVVLITSDHGEGLWDHGVRGHGQDLYEEMIRVPMILKQPGQPAARVETPVSHLDLAPTILAAVGQQSPEEFWGNSLLPSGGSEAPVRRQRYVYSELALDGVNLEAMRQGSLKLIRNRHRVADPGRLFDLTADPEEKAGQEPEGPAQAELTRTLEGLTAEIESQRLAPQRVNLSALDSATIESLRALGYIGGGRKSGAPLPIGDLVSFLDFSTGEKPQQLLSGFHELEGEFRWMAGRASVLLGRGGDQQNWKIEGYADLALHDRESLRIAVSVDGGESEWRRIESTGFYVFEGSLPPSAGPSVQIDLECEHDVIPAEDGGGTDKRSLCVLMSSVGLF